MIKMSVFSGGYVKGLEFLDREAVARLPEHVRVIRHSSQRTGGGYRPGDVELERLE